MQSKNGYSSYIESTMESLSMLISGELKDLPAPACRHGRGLYNSSDEEYLCDKDYEGAVASKDTSFSYIIIVTG